MKQEQLNAIKERVEKATSGPWKIFIDEFSTRIGSELLHPQLKGNMPVITQAYHNDDNVGIYISDNDSKFIANSREDVPALVAEVERLQKRLAQTEKCYEIMEKATFKASDKMTHFKNALEKIMEVEAPIMEGWETSAYKIAHQALGGEAHG